MKTRSVAVIACVSLLFAACGAGDEEASTDSGDGSDDTTEFVYESPLGEFLGWSDANFDQEDAEAEYAAKDREVQEAIAVCMQELGFEYTPIDTAAQQAFFEEQFNEGLEWGSDEWTAKYGFGITTQRFSQAQVGPDLVGNNYDFGPGAEGPPDPNQAYVESLSGPERDAYYEALYGGPDDFIVPVWEEEGREPTEEEIIAFEEEFQENYNPTGCEPMAFEEIYNEGAGDEDRYQEFDRAFGQALQEMEQRLESHPDVIAYREGVRECVEAKGIEYRTEEDVYQYFENELNAAGLGWENQPDPFEDLDTSDFTDEDFERIWRESQNQLLPADQLEALAELQAVEIATATAVRECGGGWQAEQRELAEVRIELEEQFLVDNADRLAEFEGVFGN
jgi:hypothetical protein